MVPYLAKSFVIKSCIYTDIIFGYVALLCNHACFGAHDNSAGIVTTVPFFIFYLSILPKKIFFLTKSLAFSLHSNEYLLFCWYIPIWYSESFYFHLVSSCKSVYVPFDHVPNECCDRQQSMNWLWEETVKSKKKNVYWIFPLWGLMPISYIYIGFHMVYILKSNATLLHVVSTWVSSYIDRTFHDKRYV